MGPAGSELQGENRAVQGRCASLENWWASKFPFFVLFCLVFCLVGLGLILKLRRSIVI